jgi:hypothetical protein
MRVSNLRRPLVSAAILAAFALAAVPGQAEDASHRPQNAAPAQGAPSSPENENQKANQSLSNPPQSGRTEPSATNAASANQGGDGNAQAPSGPALVNGKLDVPGAPADSQTVPAKFSPRNDMLDNTAIMAMPLRLTDAQKHKIVESVKLANRPEQTSNAKPSDELAWDVTVHDLGASAGDPALAELKYVRTKDRILLVDAPNRIVIGEIPN